MDELYKIVSFFASFDYNEMLNEVLNDEGLQQYIVELNQYQLHEQHIDSEGVKLRQQGSQYGYSPTYYIKQKGYKICGEKFEVFEPYSLKNSGEFYDSMKVTIDRDSFSIVGNFISIRQDYDLEKSFGKDILGLTEENLQKVFSSVEENLKDYIFNRLQKAS